MKDAGNPEQEKAQDWACDALVKITWDVLIGYENSLL
jgi:hypothetical protein